MTKTWDKPQHIKVQHRREETSISLKRKILADLFSVARRDGEIDAAVHFQFISNTEAGRYDSDPALLASHLSTFAPSIDLKGTVDDFYEERTVEIVEDVWEWVDPLDARVDAAIRTKAAAQRAERGPVIPPVTPRDR